MSRTVSNKANPCTGSSRSIRALGNPKPNLGAEQPVRTERAAQLEQLLGRIRSRAG